MKIGRALAALALGAAMTITAAQAQNVKTDWNHRLNFTQYHTFSFGKVKTSDPLYEHRLRADVTQALTAKGMTMVPSGGDVVITAIGQTHVKTEYDSFYNGLGGDGFGWGGGWGGWGGGWGDGMGGMGENTTTEQQIPVGTLVVDLYDGHSKQLAWRGESSEDLSNNGSKDRKEVEKAVSKMFKDYPPKEKK